MFDRDLLVAICRMERHTHGCPSCGWHGRYGQIRKRRTVPGVREPMGTCPNPRCGRTYKLTEFKVFSLRELGFYDRP